MGGQRGLPRIVKDKGTGATCEIIYKKAGLELRVRGFPFIKCSYSRQELEDKLASGILTVENI